MLSHLHLHLEPEERKKRALGLPFGGYRNQREFFHAHNLGRPDRLEVGTADLGQFLRQVHAEQGAQGVEYVELRLSPRRFLASGVSWAEFFEVADAVMAGSQRPRVRAILLVNRDSPVKFIAETREVVEAGLPSTFVGVDLAGDEITHPGTGRFRGLFTSARKAGLGVSVHAGEFHDCSGIWRAVDDLGATRLGHAVAAAGSAALLSRLARDQILIEVSMSSNLVLGAVPSAASHPLDRFVQAGIPVCFNTDVPLHTGHELADEYTLAARLLSVTGEEILAAQRAAHSYAFGRGPRDEPAGEPQGSTAG